MIKLLLEKDTFGQITVRENSLRSPGVMAYNMRAWCGPQNEYKVATDPHYCAGELARVWAESGAVLPKSMFGLSADRDALVAWAGENFCNPEFCDAAEAEGRV